MSARDAMPRLSPLEAFSAFPESAASKLRQLAVHQYWRDGATVFKMNEPSPRMLTILGGRMRVSAKAGTNGDVFFRWYDRGEVVGLVSIMGDLPSPVDIVAFDNCETLHIDREVLLPLLSSDAEMSLAVSRILARHVWDMVNLVTARTVNTLTERVFGVLKHLALLNGTPCGDGMRVLEISQSDIAEAVGASRQRVNLELRTLEKQKRIQLGYRQVIVYC